MNDVFEAAAELQRFCEQQNWEYCFIGGVAVQRWAEPRVTFDADLTLLTGFGSEESYLDSLLSGFKPRQADARSFALRNRVFLLSASNGVPLDVALGAVPFEENSVRRASPWQTKDGPTLLTCSAEDLIVHKAFASRAQDWADIERVILRQGSSLNLAQIWQELEPLAAAKEEPSILSRLRTLFDENLGI